MPKEVYAHEDVVLVCPNGFNTSKLLVKDRGVTIAKGKKMATIEDKPMCFTCKWSAVVAAMVAAACIAAPFIVAVIAAFVIGMTVGLGLGALQCWLVLMGSTWFLPHSKVKIGGKKALTEKAKLTCLIPGGDIQMFFSPAMADKQNSINIIKNTAEIFGAAFMGRGIRMICSAFATNGIAAAPQVIWGFIKGMGIGYLLAQVSNSIANGIAHNEEILGGQYDLIFDESINNAPLYPAWSHMIDPSVLETRTKSEKRVEAVLTDYQKPFSEPLSVGDEANYETNRAINKPSNQQSLDRFEQERINNFKTRNPTVSYRNNPNLEQQLKPEQLEAYKKQQYEQYKKDNPVSQYKNQKRWRGRQIQREQKQHSKAKETAATKTTARQNRLNQELSTDNRQAQAKQGQGANDHGRNSRQTRSNRQTARLNAKYTRIYRGINIGSLVAFFAADVVVKTMQKKDNKNLNDSQGLESKAKQGITVSALQRI